jgi:large subunit ribosomal protein L6
MNQELLETSVAVPKGVTVMEQAGSFTVKGPKGEVKRRLFHPRISYRVAGDEITISSRDVTKREKKMVFTYESHLRNMVQGVTEGHEYKLKICSGHFPMTVAIKGDILEVKNLLGEAVPRTLQLNKDTKVTVDGTTITVEGVDVEAAGQMAARIEQLTRRSGFDRRIFQDGIYITHKCGKQV